MLRIEVTSFGSEQTIQPIAADFDETGGSIGRSAANTLVLPDEKRHISRTQATITFRAGSYVLQDQGSATPTLVGGAAVGTGNEVTLRGDDEIRMGDYVLRARVQPSATHSGGMGRADAAEQDKTIIVSSAKRPPAAASIEGTQPLPPPAPAAIVASAPPPASAPAQAAARAPELAPAPEPAPESARVPATLEAGPSAASPAKSQQGEDELLRAFLEGIAMPDLKIPGGMTPELVRSIGQIMRESMRGTIEMLLARADMKREVRAEVTLISVGKNNPLKFSPTVEVALTHLLTPHGGAFMAPVDAVRDAHNDLRSHQFGFMAGMRAALERLIVRFNPTHVEQRLKGKGFFGFFTLSSRRARLWSLYEQLHREISEEADADFQTLFRREFRRAYEAQIDKLEQEDAANKR